MSKFVDWISNRLIAQKGHHFFSHFLFYFLFILPLLLISAGSLMSQYRSLTDMALERRDQISYLAATTITENLNNLVNLGVSLATRVRFRELIAAGDWEGAVAILESVPKDFPIIERVFLADPNGVLHADYPAIPEVRGQNFSDRDWYKGVSQNWQAYVSGVYRRAARPQYNVVAIAVPIRSAVNEVIGVLVLQIKLDSLFAWMEGLSLGETGFAYIVDQTGKVVVHPKFPPQAEIIDLSNVSVVAMLLEQKEGVSVTYNQIEQEERLTAYRPVEKYGWGVVVQEPTTSAFADRSREIRKLSILYGVFVLFGLFFAYLIVKMIHRINHYRQQEKIMLESIGDGVVAIDRAWNVVVWNKSAAEITGWSAGEIIGRPLRDFVKFIRERDRAENIAFIEEAMLFGKAGKIVDNTIIVRKDGIEISVGDSAAPIFDSAGKVSGAIIVFRDVSKEKESRTLKSDFAYASHQINTPVTKVLWNLESALEESDPVRLKEKLNLAYISAKSIQKLTGQLYVVSEIDQKIVAPKFEDIKLVDLVGDVLKFAQEKCQECGVSVEVEPVSPVLGIKTDSKLLKRALSEIIENALVYSKRGGKVNLKTNLRDSEMTFAVFDTGIGITEEQKPLVFTKFFRGNNFDTTQIVGAGLGLFIAKSYVQLLGGKIWFESDKAGTIFFISLPIK